MFLKSCWWEGFVMIIEFKGQTVLSVQVVQVHSRFHSVMSRSLSWERNSLISTFAHHSLEHSLTHLHIPPFSHSVTDLLAHSLICSPAHSVSDSLYNWPTCSLSSSSIVQQHEGGAFVKGGKIATMVGWGSSRWQLSWDVLLLQVSQFRLIATSATI